MTPSIDTNAIEKRLLLVETSLFEQCLESRALLAIGHHVPADAYYFELEEENSKRQPNRKR
jgi:hypothetical protein